MDVQRLLTGGGGVHKLVTGTDPAANTEVSETVPAGVAWQLHVVYLHLVADANAANRRVHLLIDDGTNEFFRLPASADQTATQSVRYTYADFGSHSNNAGHFQLSLPPLILLPGYRIRTSTTNIQATDNYAVPRLLVAEFESDQFV